MATAKVKTTTKTVKPVSKKAAASKADKTAEPKKVTNAFTVPVYTLTGTESGTLELPKEVFGKEVNKQLLAQAIRVYSANKKLFTGSTKTRGQVVGSTAKIFKQKGTGNARHGSKRAPIFVGGGIALGPQPREGKLELPKKMKKAALLNALSVRASEKQVFGLDGLDKASGKTSQIVKLLSKVAGDKKSLSGTLIVTGEKSDKLFRAARNIEGVTALSTEFLNAYEVLKHQTLAITKEAVEKLANPKKEAIK